ncbi:hypothetical protein [Flavobacterium sp. WC2430]|uniref:hypothetical protein n=1 Tax=Flavobacterium sp. WC2430 TaxID=3234137 RepID=UPI00346565F4
MIEPNNRFQDQNLRLTDFQQEVWVSCISCGKKAIASANYETKTARLFCVHCGYNKEKTTTSTVLGNQGNLIIAAHIYFDAELWLQMSFKETVFFAYNDEHLVYLKRYITATLREHKDRTHFTLLEKLPRFYHEAKNREALLKIINKLKKK